MQYLLAKQSNWPNSRDRHLTRYFVNFSFLKDGLISPTSFGEEDELGAKMDFLKERVGIEVGFGHASFIGIDLLKFQVSSYSALNQIDVGIYVATTRRFQKYLSSLGQNWEGSLTFEKVTKYLPQFKSAIQVPIYVIGIDV